jgi:hypothetical protein
MAKLKRHDNFLTEKGNYDPKEFYKGKTLDPKTPVNMAKYRLALNAAEQNILSAIKALKYIPRIDWDETIPDTINKLETLLSSDNGEAGFSLFVAKAEKDGLKESADSALAIDGMELPKYFKGDDLKYIKNLQSGQSLQAQDKKGKFVRVNYANKLYTLIYDKLSESILESKEVFWLSNVP